MADVTQNMEFVFSATDTATPVAAKVATTMGTIEDAAVESAETINDSLTEAITLLTTAVDDLSSGLGTTKDDLDEVSAQAEKSKGRLLSLSGSFSFLKRMAGNFSLGAALGAGAGAGLKAFEGISKLLSPLADLIGEVFGPAIELMTGAFKSQLAPISALLVDLAHKVLPGLISAFQPLVLGVMDFVSSFSAILSGEDSPLVDVMEALKSAFTTLQPVISEVFKVIGENAKVLLPVVARLATILIKTLAPILTTVVKFIGRHLLAAHNHVNCHSVTSSMILCSQII